jgi:hypothetical protein
MALDLAAIRGYLQVPATLLTDDDLTRMIAAARADQRARCVVVPTDDAEGVAALEQALLRRVQREVAARNLPLGMVGLDGAEYGPSALAAYDALVEQHERAYRSQVVG